MSDRPSLESVIDRYTRMRSEMIAALDDELGPAGWAESASSRGLDFGACEGVIEAAPPGTDTAFLPRFRREGTYDDPQVALATIDRVGRGSGFGELEKRADNGTTAVYAAVDHLGAVYEVHFARNMVIGIQTGCHAWDHKPSAPLPTGRCDPVTTGPSTGWADGVPGRHRRGQEGRPQHAAGRQPAGRDHATHRP